MDKESRKEFFKYVRSAKLVELERKLIRLECLEHQLQSQPAIRDLRYMRSTINEEIAARREVGQD